MFAQILIFASAALVFLSGVLHLLGSFFVFDNDLKPKVPALIEQMKNVALNISPATDMWRAWIGFNALFSIGLLLFGLVYGYLSLFSFDTLTKSPILLLVGALYLAGLTGLAGIYLFSLPTLGFALCFILFCIGVGVALI